MYSFQHVIQQKSERSELSRAGGFIQDDPSMSDGKQNPGSSLRGSSLQALTALLSSDCQRGGLSSYFFRHVQVQKRSQARGLSFETNVRGNDKVGAIKWLMQGC